VRPVWLCFELELAAEIVPVDFSPAYRNTPEWRAISPAGKLPALTDGDLTMFESGAMVDYILDRYGQGRLRPPAGTPERALCQQWCWFSEATLLRPIGLAALRRDPPEAIVASAAAKADEALDVVDAALSGGAYMLGAGFSAADIMMGYALAFLDHLQRLDSRRNAVAYLQRLKTRPAFQRALSA
jgi:glutathione S-transferase